MLNEEQVWDLYSLENYNDPGVASMLEGNCSAVTRQRTYVIVQ